MQNWKKGYVFGHIDKFLNRHDAQIKKNASKNAYLGSIFIPEKYVFRVCFENPFTRMISSLKYKCPPPPPGQAARHMPPHPKFDKPPMNKLTFGRAKSTTRLKFNSTTAIATRYWYLPAGTVTCVWTLTVTATAWAATNCYRKLFMLRYKNNIVFKYFFS